MNDWELFLFSRNGDCYQTATFTSCNLDTSVSCSLSASSTTTLQSCASKRADYLFVRYKCVPSKLQFHETFFPFELIFNT